MDTNDYSMKSLSDIFLNHADKFEKNNYKELKNFIDNYPESKVPEHLVNTFNIARALSVMAKEINELKDWIRRHMRNEHPYV